MKLAGSIITVIQVGEVRQRSGDVIHSVPKWIRYVWYRTCREGKSTFASYFSALPHCHALFFQVFPAGASFLMMSSVLCCLFAGWQWAILKWIRVLLLISFQVPPVDNPCFRLIKPTEGRLSHRSLSTNRRC